jgi:alpha-L-rhamnosidase
MTRIGSPFAAQFFNRIILGIRQTEPGGRAFEISPRLCGLTFASGAMATPLGAVHVDWRLAEKTLRVRIHAPEGVKVAFRPNEEHSGLHVVQASLYALCFRRN